jgi:preprotein translocase subunit YajC
MQQFLPLVFLLVVMYFLLIRPQQQRVKQQRALISSLEVGDEVVTVGGLIARIVSIDDDTVVLEPAPGLSLRFRRAAVSSRVPDRDGNDASADDASADDGGADADDQSFGSE